MENNQIKEDNDIFMKNIQDELIYSEIQKYLHYFNPKAQPIITEVICQILYPYVFLKCMQIPKEIYEKYHNDQLFPEILMYCLKHQNDETYDDILLVIKNKINEQQEPTTINQLINQSAGSMSMIHNNLYKHKYMKYKLKYIKLEKQLSEIHLSHKKLIY